MKNFFEIIENIKEIMEFKTDQEVADMFEWPRQTINNYKKENRIPFKHLVEFCEYENVSLDWLISGRGEKHPEPTKKQITLEELNEKLDDLKKHVINIENKLKK